MFGFFKKKKKFFGNNVEPSCDYCRFNYSESEIKCKYYKGDVCKKYTYDPLKRKPKSARKLKTYTKEDFSL